MASTARNEARSESEANSQLVTDKDQGHDEPNRKHKRQDFSNERVESAEDVDPAEDGGADVPCA